MSLKFPAALKELRIHFGPGAQGNQVKTFLNQNYESIKRANPHTPILIREALGVKPVAYARFNLGEERTASLEGDVRAALQKLVGHN